MKHRNVIARIDVARGGDLPVRATGTLIGDRLVLTALHVVADRRSNPPAFFPGPIKLTFPQLETTAMPIDGLWDIQADWVLLECEKSPRGAIPVPLGELTPFEKIDWETFGFPDLNPGGQVIAGAVRDPEGEYLGVRAIQLFSDEAAAGDGAPVAGLSGGPCLVEETLVGVIRSSLLKRGANVAGTLFACPIAGILDRAGARLPLPDPLRGLPGLPRRDLPSTPFRDLQAYGAADAEIFFGRGREIRSLYDLVTGDGAPIVLVYGQSGVGKSSLLEAGLFPRLMQVQTVCGSRRDGTRGLAGTLDDALGVSRPTSSREIADAWRAFEHRSGKQALVWIDQVEEAWTRADLGQAIDPIGEIGRLLDRCEALFAHIDQRPLGKLVLAFRKEYLPEIEISLERRKLPFARYFVEPMGRPSVAEVVLGPARTERLRRKYGYRVEDGLDQTIAEVVCADARSPVAPTLQIFMTRLWTAATALSGSSPFLDRDLLKTIEKRDDYLADFLDRQMAIVGARHSDAEKIGLLLDLVAFHTTEMSTAEERTRGTIAQEYSHLELAALDYIITDLVTARLLADTGGDAVTRGGTDRKTRLVHDTLAPRVRARFEQSQRPGQRARRILAARANQNPAPLGLTSGADTEPALPLTPSDLAMVKLGRDGMRCMSPAEEAIVAATEKDQAAQRAEEERRQAEQRAAEEAVKLETERRQVAERRTRNALAVFAGAVLVAGIVAGILWWRASREADARARRVAESLFTAAQGDVSNHGDVTRALLGIANAVQISPEDWARRDVYISRVAHLAASTASRAVPLGGNLSEATISSDGRRVVVIRAGSEVQVRDGQNGSLLKTLPVVTAAQQPSGESRVISPAISPSGMFAAALLPSIEKPDATLVVAWDCAAGTPWLHAALPREMAITPNQLRLAVTDDGWVIARIEALGFDLGGGMPYATSSAMAVAWQHDTKGVNADRPPDRILGGIAMDGDLAAAPAGPARVAVFLEKGSADRDARAANMATIESLSTGDVRRLESTALTPPDTARSIAWSEDGERVVVAVARGDKDSIFELRIDGATRAESFQSSMKIEPSDNHQQPKVVDLSSSTALVVVPTKDPSQFRLISWPIGRPPGESGPDIESVTIPLSNFRRFVAFGPEGMSIVAMGDDNQIRVFDRRSGALLRPPVGVPVQLVAARMVDERRTLATISRDGVLLRWGIRSVPIWNEPGPSPLPRQTSSNEARESRSILEAAFASDLSAVALVVQPGGIGVVKLPGDVANEGRIPMPTSWTSPSEISVGDDSSMFPDFHALALNVSGRIAVAARSHIGRTRERIAVQGNKPCMLSLPIDYGLVRFTLDARSVIACSARGCQFRDTLTCATPSHDIGTIPSTTLGTGLLAIALARGRSVSLIPQIPNSFEIDLGAGTWRTTLSAGAVSTPVWVDSKTGLEITPPVELDRPSTRLVVLAASADGRSIAVAAFSPGGSVEVGAWDTGTGRPTTLLGASWPLDAKPVAATFSSDGQWLYVLASDRTILRQWIVGRSHRPEWVVDSVHALTGYRLVGNNILEALDVDQLTAARTRAIADARAADRNGDAAARLALQALEPDNSPR